MDDSRPRTTWIEWWAYRMKHPKRKRDVIGHWWPGEFLRAEPRESGSES